MKRALLLLLGAAASCGERPAESLAAMEERLARAASGPAESQPSDADVDGLVELALTGGFSGPAAKARARLAEAGPAAAERLLEAARGTDPVRRLWAARAIARTPHRFVVLGLVLRLKYEREALVVPSVAEALAAHENLAGVAALFAPVEVRDAPAESHDSNVRAEIVRALRAIEARRAAQESASGGGDPEASEEDALAEGRRLARAWSEAAGAGRANPKDLRYELGIARLVRQLGQYQLREVDDARFVLARLGGDPLPFLEAGALDPNTYVRAHSLEVLGALGAWARPARGALERAAAGGAHRAVALEALGLVGGAGARSILERALGDRDPEARSAAALGLRRLGDPASGPALRAALAASTDPDFRLRASATLVLLGETEGLRALGALADSPAADTDEWWEAADLGFRLLRARGLDDLGWARAADRAERRSLARAYASATEPGPAR